MLSIGYNVHLWLALFIILAMLVSALASLTLVPGLVLSLRPAFIFGRASGGAKALATASMLMLAVGAAVGASPTIARAEALTPSAIMEKNCRPPRCAILIADATFTLINKDGEERVRRTNGYTKLQDNGSDNMRSVRFLSPGDIKGTATLLIEHATGDDDMWIYLPALKKVRRSGRLQQEGQLRRHRVQLWRRDRPQDVRLDPPHPARGNGRRCPDLCDRIPAQERRGQE